MTTYTAQGVEIVNDHHSWEHMSFKERIDYINKSSMDTKANIIARKIKRNEHKSIKSIFRKKAN